MNWLLSLFTDKRATFLVKTRDKDQKLLCTTTVGLVVGDSYIDCFSGDHFLEVQVANKPPGSILQLTLGHTGESTTAIHIQHKKVKS